MLFSVTLRFGRLGLRPSACYESKKQRTWVEALSNITGQKIEPRLFAQKTKYIYDKQTKRFQAFLKIVAIDFATFFNQITQKIGFNRFYFYRDKFSFQN